MLEKIELRVNESLFIKLNKEKWIEVDDAIQNKDRVSPDVLTNYFIRLTDDLSFAKTYFPNSKTHAYLNELTSNIHQLIYKNKRESSRRIITFWKYELPRVVYECRRELLYSLVIFLISTIIGAVSANLDDNFARLILGDAYINMTEANIEKDDPMAVYKSAKEIEMFFGITINNIRVSFMVFAFGILGSFGAAYFLMSNGIMLGAFQCFFYTKGLLATSALTIWVHGTIEISSIIIAGGAGMVLGNSILFPGTYSRMVSFRKGAKKGLKIVIGLVPLFIIAGFLESYITRLTDIHDAFKLLIIGASLVLIVYYFVIYPIKLHKNGNSLRTKN